MTRFKLLLIVALLVGCAAIANAGFNEGKAAYERGDYAKALKELKPLAEQGNANAQCMMGKMYNEGHGVPQDYVQAHMWFNLAAGHGFPDAEKYRDEVAKEMTPSQIDEAQRLAKERKHPNRRDTEMDTMGILVVLLLIVLSFLFYLVFRWSQRNEQASYLGTVFRESVFDFELSRRTRRVAEKRDRGEYEDAWSKDDYFKGKEEPKSPEPDPQLLPYMDRAGGSGSGIGHLGGSSRRPGTYNPYVPPLDPWADASGGYVLNVALGELKPDLQPLFQKYTKDLADYQRARNQWNRRVNEARKLAYQDDINKAFTEAKEAAALAGDVDIGVFRGRGPTFVLEFTTIVVIIFTVLILGILEKLDSQQIGTLLAAIAGYVLGRATTGSRQSEQGTQKQVEQGGAQGGS
ncbi:MAG: tetratricopeptide repeat protein [Syntrophobacteraceae bacterium]